MSDYSKEFEAFCAKSGYAGDTFKTNLWKVWQASREAIEVDLPEPFDKYESGEGMYFADEVDKAIQVAGLKVKE